MSRPNDAVKQKCLLAAWAALLSLFLSGVHSSGMEPVRERSPAKGLFLIADSRLTDRHFRESVVLLTHHGADGTVGVIVNRPTTRPLSSVLPGLPIDEKRVPLFIGGPVSRNILSLLLQTERPPQEMETVLDGLYFSGDARPLAGLLKDASRFRVFSGYAGWAAGQLQGEIDRGDWQLLPADAALLFQSDPETIWFELFRRAQQRAVGIPFSTGPPG